MSLNSKSPKILILDTHSGAACFMHALFGEMGMEAEVLSDMIIHDNPQYSPFGASPFPFGELPPESGKGAVAKLFALALFILRNPITVMRHSGDYWHGRLWRAGMKWRNYIRFSSFYLFNRHFCGRRIIDEAMVEALLRMPRWRKFFSRFDVLVCAFPPMVFQFIKHIADAFDQRLILNMGHRFNLLAPPDGEYNESLKKELLDLIRDERHGVGAMTRYDQLYTHHYLSKLDDSLTPDSVPLLGAKAFYIPMRAKKTPASNVALVTPVHANSSYSTLPLSVAQMNQSYEKFCQANKMQPAYVFKSMREHWPESYSYEDLGAFAGAAVVNFAYSSFSFSGLEVYDCNIPFFYADEKFLIRHDYDKDYRLHPVHIDEEEYQNMEADIDDPDSPNGRSVEARRAWLRHAENQQRQNAIAFSDYDDLFAKMHEAAPRYAEISRAMHEENSAAREAMLQAWRRILEGVGCV